MTGETILVVDDSRPTRDFMVDYVLKPKGYRAILAVDGEEGVQLALEQHPDLIILDMELPRMDGMEVLHALKARGLNIPVIMATAHGSEQVAIEAFRLGVRDYVPKPFEVNGMIKTIEHALAETRMRKERDELFSRLLQTNRSLEARLRELNTLYGISKSVTMLLDHDSLLRRIVEAAQFVTGAQMCLLRLHDCGRRPTAHSSHQRRAQHDAAAGERHGRPAGHARRAAGDHADHGGRAAEGGRQIDRHAGGHQRRRARGPSSTTICTCCRRWPITPRSRSRIHACSASWKNRRNARSRSSATSSSAT